MSDDYTIEQIRAHFEEHENVCNYLEKQLNAAGHRYSWSAIYVDKDGLNFEVDTWGGHTEWTSVPLEDIVGHDRDELLAAHDRRQAAARKAAEERAEKQRIEREALELEKARELIARYENRHPDEELG